MKNIRGQGSQSVRRAAQVIREVAFANRDGARLVDLARILPIERPTIHRLLKTLVEERLVVQDESTRRYFLGQGMFELGLTASSRFNPRDLCRPILERIADETQDTVFLLFRAGLEVVCVDRKDGAFPIKVFSMNVGDRRPLGAGAGGLAVLSGLPDSEVREIAKATQTKRKGTSLAQLLAAVDKTRSAGYAVHEGELAEVRALAVAIKGKSGEPFAALSFTAVKSRVDGPRIPHLVKLLKQAAHELEQLTNHQDRAEWRF